MPPEEEQNPAPPKPRRRWRRRLLWFFVILAAFLVWANGPGLRWLLTKVIHSQLEAQQLTGTFEVKGTALSGISLHQVSLTGPALIQSARSNLIEITWSPSSLIDLRVESLTVERLHLTIDPSALPLEKDSEEVEKATDPAPLSETLDLVRGIIENTDLSLTDLRVELLDTTEISLASLTHSATTETYLIKDLRTRDHLGRPIHNPSTTLVWTDESLQADIITLRPNLSLNNITFVPDQKASLDLFIDRHRLNLTSDLKSNHRLNLLSSDLPISDILKYAQPDFPLSGTITELKVDTSKGSIDLQLKDLSYQTFHFKKASLVASTPDLLSPFNQPVELELALDKQLVVNGTITPDREPLDSAAELSFALNWPGIPTVTGDLAYDSREARILAESLETLRLTGRYLVDSQTYRAEAVAAIKDVSTFETPVVGPLTFTARARGDLKSASHSGTLKLSELNLRQPDFPKATSSGVITWDWPNKVEIQNLTMTSPEGVLKAKLAWENDTLAIEKLDLVDGDAKLLSVTASLPASLDMRSPGDFLASPQPASLKISSQPLSFKKLSSFAPLPKDLRGVFQADLALSGTLAKPTLDGFATLDDFRLATQPDLPPVSLNLNLKTTDQTLAVSAKVREPGGPLLDLEGTLPFLPRAWLDHEADPTEAPVTLTAKTPDIDLRRIQPFAPVISSIDGSLNLDLLLSGTLAAPKLSGSANANIAKMRLKESPISDFRNSTIKATIEDNRITVLPSTINASGGTATLAGNIDLNNGKPVFGLNLKGDYILLYRTPDFTFRGHPDLRLSGSLDKAVISGTLKLAESLIYKDVEILPFGITRTTEVPTPTLPSFSARKTTKTNSSGPPTGPMNWGLDIEVTTADPILIRGNLVSGKVTGTVKVFGTINDPKTSGTLTTEELVADLPFSELEVQTGILTLQPDSLTNPVIDLRGSSNVGQYVIQIYLRGPVQDPKLVLTSDPPMPESEIMLLLATGSASDQLADQTVASQKALQYLLEGLRRRNRGKDKTVLQRLIKNSDQIQLSLGDTNQFSGRRFSSASLEITDNWDFTTQIDDQGQTRALVVFSLRFK